MLKCLNDFQWKLTLHTDTFITVISIFEYFEVLQEENHHIPKYIWQEYDKLFLPNLNDTNHTTYVFKNVFSLINQCLSHDAKIQWQGLLLIIVETSLTKKHAEHKPFIFVC